MTTKGNGYISKSKTDSWLTPSTLYKQLNDIHKFNYDPCPYKPIVFKDGLTTDWGTCNFVNPPYSDIAKWVKKAHLEATKGNKSVMLIPSRTDTRYFHDYIYKKYEIEFLKGRLKFVDPENVKKKPMPSPFPSMLVIFETKKNSRQETDDR